MGNTRHKLAVFIGRFQPFHIGHHTVIAAVAGKATSMLVLIGSAYRPRSWKNPFSYQERYDFLMEGVGGSDMQVD
ncbi:MAG TPA: bifunctional nicotinamide-nucleotide adenylyltransferase/Nudix hydroxylase, partial [Rhodobacteraceae bacterium]|nr:bifunctional nicotinamide-nucleotide adenylyltransferase/Nudix hydroxylase [Paracoccaceae bacterium]